MAIDISTLEGFKRKRGRQRDPYLKYRQLDIAMTYYRYLYADGETRQTAIRRIENEYRPRISLTTIKDALAYFDEDTKAGREHLRLSIAYGLYQHYKILTDVITSYGLKPPPYWVTDWQTLKR